MLLVKRFKSLLTPSSSMMAMMKARLDAKGGGADAGL